MALIVSSKSLKTLGLNNLKKIDNGKVFLQTESLCLFDSIDWGKILTSVNNFNIKSSNIIYAKENCGKLL